MISRAHRFHGHNSLNYVYRHGKTERVEYLAIRVAPSKRQDYRLAVVVSKKISKSAVTRNRIRRRLYETMRVLSKESASLWPFDVVLTVHDERVAKMSADELCSSLLKLLKKSKIYSPS